MSIEWKYKIDLAEDTITTISRKYNITIPEDLVKLLEKANGATPSKTKFMVKVDEKILGAILSFNLGEVEADNFETAMNIGFERDIIPFGIDPFGNYICYRTKDKSILFFDHEEDTMTVISETLKDFLEMLYE